MHLRVGAWRRNRARVATGCLLGVFCLAEAPAEVIVQGRSFPMLGLRDLHSGVAATLQDPLGSKVLVLLFGSWDEESRRQVEIWRRLTREPRRRKKLRVVVVAEEQHPQRARLFLQWKRIDWTVLADPFDLLEVAEVPRVVLEDPSGIVRQEDAGEDQLGPFLAREFPGSRPAAGLPVRPPVSPRQASRWQRVAQRDYRRLGLAGISSVIRSYRLALEEAANPLTLFRLGVAYRMRYDSRRPHPTDFQRAVIQWRRAAEADPEFRLARRRLQQYGPRKGSLPPAYGWVSRARREIRQRGETPLPLAVSPGKSETGEEDSSPAVAGRVPREISAAVAGLETEHRIRVETAVVPDQVERGGAVRFYAILRPLRQGKLPVQPQSEMWFRVEPPGGWRIESPVRRFRALGSGRGRGAFSVEFEMVAPEQASGTFQIPATAFFCGRPGTVRDCPQHRLEVAFRVRVR